MDPQDSVILEIYKYMNEKGVLISYLGDFNFNVVNSLLASVKKVIHDSGIDFQNQKRFYAVAAECLDNVNRYNYAFTGDKVSEIYTKTYFNISEDKNCFIIQTGNYIHADQRPALSAKLDKVNSLDKEGLKAFYRHKLAESPTKGGGLGVIDISIRTGGKIIYEFKPVKDDVLFLFYKLLLKNKLWTLFY